MKADFTKLDRAFNPRCVVVVGDKADFRWLRGQSSFKGKLYSVQIDPKEIEGIKALGVENYTSLLDIPEAIDLAIVVVPRAVTPRMLEDCIRKEVAAAQFGARGFSETDTEEGLRLERQLTERAEQANFHLIGPHSAGIFNPSVGVRQSEAQYTGVSGVLGFISQSGGYATGFAPEAHLEGIDINKSVSFGNGIVLDSADYLEYFSYDPGIKIIAMYLEGVRDGRRFFKVLREVAARKPVVIWKGGRTEGGQRATASHTGSLAVPWAIWDTVVRQCGAIKVASREELIDTVKALLYLSPVRGDRVGITGAAGGQSAVIADVFAEAGLRLPPLTQESYDELAPFFTPISGGYRNPIDTGNVSRREKRRILETLERDANIDNLVLVITPRPGPGGQLESDMELMTSIRERSPKSVMALLPYSFSSSYVEQAGDIMRKLQDGGVATFFTPERGARALKNALDYYSLKNSIGTR